MSRLGLETIILTEPYGYRLGTNPYRITIREGVFQDAVISNTLNGVPIADLFPVGASLITTDAVAATLITTAIATSAARMLIAEIMVASGAGATASFKISCKVVNIAGVLTLSPSFDQYKILDATLATITATFVVSTTNVIVQVTGVAATTINWRCSLISRSTTF